MEVAMEVVDGLGRKSQKGKNSLNGRTLDDTHEVLTGPDAPPDAAQACDSRSAGVTWCYVVMYCGAGVLGA